MQAGGSAKGRTMIVATEERDKGSCESARVNVGDENTSAIVLNDVRQTAGVERDHRRLAELGLDSDESKAFANGWNDERRGIPIELREARLRQSAMPTNATGNPECLGKRRKRFSILAVANDVERE